LYKTYQMVSKCNNQLLMISAGNSKLFVLMFMFYGYYCPLYRQTFWVLHTNSKIQGQFWFIQNPIFSFVLYKTDIKTCRIVWGWV